jgi:hypothetical protein
MRNLVIGICSFAFFLLILLVGYTVTGKERRTAELERALNLAMEQTLEQLSLPDAYSPADDEELVAMFEQQLLVQLNGQADYEIHVLDVDAKKGLLSVEVSESFSYINGESGSISARRLILLEQVAEAETDGTRTLTYYLGDEVYRSYELDAGSCLIVPEVPYTEAEHWNGWRSLDDGKLYSEEMLKEMVLSEDMSFTADGT